MSAAAQPLGASGSRTQKRLVPERPEWLDLGFLAVLGLVASYGLHQSYTGRQFLLVAALGLVLGMAIGHIAAVLRQPVVVVALATLAVYFLLGGAVALRSQGVASMLPGPGTVVDLARRGAEGWKQLLTTLPPVDGAGPLLVLPWLLALGYGACAVTVTQRVRSVLWAALVPVLLLSAVILLGARDPGSLAPQALLFAVVLIAWLAVRTHRTRPAVRRRAGRAVQLALAGALVAGCALVAVPLAGHGPGSGHPRVVLRTWVEPPFAVGRYPSPLVGFRRYAQNRRNPDATLWKKTVLTVHGVPEGTRVRFAALDAYDGRVWGAADQSPDSDGAEGTFQRVGSRIPGQAAGRVVDARITLGPDYTGVWLPTLGRLRSITFLGDRAEAEQDSFRYNLATDTGIVPVTVSPGSSYQVSAVIHDDPVPARTADWKALTAAPGVLPLDPGAATLQTQALEWGPPAGSPMARLAGIADTLRERGRFTNGDTAQTQMYGAGHYVTRLADFVRGQEIVGDDEQFAATFAIMANQVGVPARVVMGGVTEAGGVVRGKDVHAWAEVQLADGEWHTVPQTAFMDQTKKPSDTPPNELAQAAGENIPPPRALQPPSTMGDPAVPDNSANRQQEHHPDGFTLPAWVWLVIRWVLVPLLVVVLLAGAVVGAKGWRRARRRTRGSPGQRVANGWAEVADTARDLGHTVPRGTRRQQAAAIGLEPVTELATRADRITFGPVDLSEETVTGFWSSVDDVRHRVTADLGLRARVRAALNLTTFRPGGAGARLGAGVRASLGVRAGRPQLHRRTT